MAPFVKEDVTGLPRRNLGAFLRSRREAIEPESVGLPRGRRRLARGLRREEVASLSEIGVTWYTWLEQGRPVRVSSDALARITKVLRLTPEEGAYLFALAEKRTSAPPELIVDVPAGVRDILDASAGLAVALNVRLDHLAWNAAAGRIYGLDVHGSWESLNHVVRMFTDPARKMLISNWPAIADASVAVLRSHHAQQGADARFDEIFSALAGSRDFERAWGATTVGRPPFTRIELSTVAGPVELQAMQFQSPALPGVVIFFQTPVDASSAQNLARALEPASDATSVRVPDCAPSGWFPVPR